MMKNAPMLPFGNIDLRCFMSELSKQVRKQAGDLIGIAYSRELNHHLNNLAQRFDEWRQNTLDCWELNDLIHQFHDGISRDLYKTYSYSNDQVFLISRALALGFLKKDELSKELNELADVLLVKFRVDKI